MKAVEVRQLIRVEKFVLLLGFVEDLPFAIMNSITEGYDDDGMRLDDHGQPRRLCCGRRREKLLRIVGGRADDAGTSRLKR